MHMRAHGRRWATIVFVGLSTNWPHKPPKKPGLGIDAFTLAIDRRYPTGDKKRSSVLTILRGGLEQIFERQPICGEGPAARIARITWQTRDRLPRPAGPTRPRC